MHVWFPVKKSLFRIAGIAYFNTSHVSHSCIYNLYDILCNHLMFYYVYICPFVGPLIWTNEILSILSIYSFLVRASHPTTGYLDNRCYRELRSYLRHTEWQVGISLTFFFHFIYFLDFKFMSDLLHYKWEICIPNMTV